MRIITFLIVFSISSNVHGQIYPIDSLMYDLNEMQKRRLKIMFEPEERDSTFREFDKVVMKLFSHPRLCKYIPDTSLYLIKYNPSLKNEPMHRFMQTFLNNIVISASGDEKVKLWSWDALTGGSAHYYYNYLQFEKSEGACEVIEFDTAEFTLSVGYYDVQTIKEKAETFYFLFGYGTYGSGMHHMKLKIMIIEDDRLSECFSCYPEGESIKAFSNRSQDLFMDYDNEKKELKIKQYVYDEDIGFYTDSSFIVSYDFIKGKFTSKIAKEKKSKLRKRNSKKTRQ